jgi:hypothetical protein
MPRPRVAPTDDWHQIELLARAPGQRTYELIRPVVLFGQSLWRQGDDDWLPVLRLPAYAPRRPRPAGAVQPALFPLDDVGT